MRSAVVKRSIIICGHKTSVSLEEEFWQGLRDIACEQGMTLSALVGEIDRARRHSNLSSAIRLFVLDRLCMALSKAAASSHETIKPGGSLSRSA